MTKLEYDRLYYARNKKIILERKKIYYNKNRAKILEYSKKYSKRRYYDQKEDSFNKEDYLKKLELLRAEKQCKAYNRYLHKKNSMCIIK